MTLSSALSSIEVDRGDAADPVVAGDLVDQVLDRVRLRRGVAVDAEQVVHVLDQE